MKRVVIKNTKKIVINEKHSLKRNVSNNVLKSKNENRNDKYIKRVTARTISRHVITARTI